MAENMVSERSFKSRLLWMAIIAKLVVFFFVYTLWRSGSFTQEQFMGIITVLIPIFGTYVSFFIKDATANRYGNSGQEKKVTKQFTRVAYGTIVFYGLAVMFILNLRGPGTISMETMNGLLGTAEASIGGYVTFVMSKVYDTKKG